MSIQELFHEALRRPPEARRAFLEEACDDPAVRREVEALLAADAKAEADRFLQQPVLEGVARRLFEDALDDSDPLVSETIGPYRIRERVGEGGMGIVYRAERTQPFRQEVALKVIRNTALPSDAIRRFEAERQILAALNHPSIAKLLDGGTLPDGRPYFVMEYVEGQPITDYCAAHRLSIDERLELFQMVCRAVHYAHQRLVVHRDLKPSNILVTEDPANPGHAQIKLLDFGVAKLLDPSRTDVVAADVPVTRTHQQLMTLAYAAPEQVRGERITTATDVYALGVVLYELLAGTRPYHVANAPLTEVERIVCETTPERPSTKVQQGATGDRPGSVRSSDELARHLRGDLDTIAMMALRKEPARRYASAEQFAADIERHRRGFPVEARPDTGFYRIRKFARRHRTVVVAALLVGLALLAGLAGTTWQAQRAAQQAERALRERDKAEQVTAFLMNLFEANDPNAALGDTVTARTLLQRGLARADALDDRPDVQAQMYDVIGRVYRQLGRYDEAERVLQQALDRRRQLFGPAHLDVAVSLNELAEALEDQGRADTAEVLYREALDIRRRLAGPRHALTAASLNNLGELLVDEARYAEADSLLVASLALRRAAFGSHHPETAVSLSNLGMLYWQQGRFDRAEPLLREALAIRRDRLGPRHVEITWSLNDLAIILEDRGKLAEAEALLREAIAMERGLYGEAHPEIATALGNLASVVAVRGRLDEARALEEEALAMRRRLLGPDHPEVAIGLNNLAAAQRRDGDLEAAARTYDEAIERLRRAFGAHHVNVAYSLLGRARTLLDQGQAAAAESPAREALALRQAALPADHWLMGETKSVLGACLAAQRRFADAEPLLLDGYDGLRRTRGPESRETVDALRRLVALYEAWENPVEAGRYRDSLAARAVHAAQ